MHGPIVLARSTNVVVTLRSIVAYSTGLDLSVVARAWGAESERMELQFTAPAEIDSVSGRPRRGEMHRERLQLRALDDSTLSPYLTRAPKHSTNPRTAIAASIFS